jgi:hypothetical protein
MRYGPYGLPRLIAAALVATLATSRDAGAQWDRSPLPRSRADVLLDSGLWPQAEEAYYAQSRVNPRAPAPRAALGRYLAMKGAVLPGTILIEEAQRFGLDSVVARRMLRPWRAVLGWRSIATIRADSVVTVRPPRDSTALFQLALPSSRSANVRGAIIGSRTRDTIWADVVPRTIGSDSLYAIGPRVGIELLEGLIPAYDSATHRLTLHADARAAARVAGRRYAVLRDPRDVRVLMTTGRTLSLAPALRELGARWWQLDLPHGVLIVRNEPPKP